MEYTTNVKSHEGLVQELAKRWWYVIPDWPPEKFDYTLKLTENGLWEVDLTSWKIEEEELDGLRKCVELDTFPGVFTD